MNSSRVVMCMTEGCINLNLPVRIEADVQSKYSPVQGGGSAPEFKKVRLMVWPAFVCAECGVEPQVMT